MRVAMVCGPLPETQLLKSPLARFEPLESDWSRGYPVKQELVTTAGWWRIDNQVQWLQAGWMVEGDTFIVRPI